jgi:hypothetical protein
MNNPSTSGATCTREEKGPTTLAAFPNEVFEAIFTHLSPLELSRLARSSRTLYHISTRSSLWEQAYLSFWREGDDVRERERGTRAWRERRRFRELKEAARRAWIVDGITAAQGPSHTKRARTELLPTNSDRAITPFPQCLSGGPPDRDNHVSVDNQGPHFYRLFLERIRIDEEVLRIVSNQCQSSNIWLERVRDVVERYGNDAKDVLHALVASQTRRGDNEQDSAMLPALFSLPRFRSAFPVQRDHRPII